MSRKSGERFSGTLHNVRVIASWPGVGPPGAE